MLYCRPSPKCNIQNYNMQTHNVCFCNNICRLCIHLYIFMRTSCNQSMWWTVI